MSTLKRRSLLKHLINLSIASSAIGAVAPSFASQQRRPIGWKNWSGSQSCQPTARHAPGTLTELQQLVAQAQGCVRPVGSGHSFSPLVPTDHTLISLARMTLPSQIHDDLSATISAGTRLGDLGEPLARQGQALINMPDIDEQSLAGALATATHGTGAGIGCLSSFIKAMTLVTAEGDVLHCSRSQHPDVFDAARVNLGTLGLVTDIRLQNTKPYFLKRETEWLPIEEILANAEQLADNNRNVEFYYIPFSGMGFTDVHNVTTESTGSSNKLDQNDGAETLKDLRDWLGFSPKIRELVLSSYMKSLDKEVSVAASWQNYASERNVRFNEMEYHLPRAEGLKAVAEIRTVLEENFNDVFFPIEVRFVKQDDIWLSPFYQRDCISIAVHRYFNEDYRPYFKAIEPIFRKYGGRPHWGKLNTLNRQDLAALYPRWEAFEEVRRQLDPNGKFLNPYLRSLFAPE